MRTCWSNFLLRLSSSQSCLVRNTLSKLDSDYDAFITGQTLDIDHLDSLDPELYRNLLALKTYEGDVQVSVSNASNDIQYFNFPPQDYVGIDFTVVVEEFGQTRIELLKPEGDSIPVTSENRSRFLVNNYVMTLSNIHARTGQNHLLEEILMVLPMLMIQPFRIEYIHLVADYKLNRQIKAQCSAFRFKPNSNTMIRIDICVFIFI